MEQEYIVTVPHIGTDSTSIKLFDDSKIKMAYEYVLRTPSDINQLLPTLHKYAQECEHVTEMGARGGRSTITFIHANPTKFVSYDYQYANPEKHLAEEVNTLKQFIDECKQLGRDVSYIGADVLSVEIEETDLLFIDTWHVYQQLKEELRLHAGKVRKYLAFHDIETFGVVGEGYPTDDDNHPRRHEYDESNTGIYKAIEEFLQQHPEWVVEYETKINNGLLILKKI